MRTLTIIFTLFLISCIKDEPSVTLINNSNQIYDSVKIYVVDIKPLVFKDIDIKSRHTGTISFDSSVKGDGCYKLEIYSKGKLEHENCFGYFTNGASLNARFRIEIQKDSVLIEMD